MPDAPRSDRVLIARIGAAHGIRGEVRVKAYTADPAGISAYGPLEADDGRLFEVATLRRAAGPAADMLVVKFRGVADRNAAEALNGVELSILRGRLPPAGEDEYYHADLVGLVAVTRDGAELGTVIAVQNYGAGDLLEIAPKRGETLLVPFTRAVVPNVDLASGRVIIVPPEELPGAD